MLNKINMVGVALLVFFLDGCTRHDIKRLREVNQSEEHIINMDRALNIRYNDTAYSKALEVYGEFMKQYLIGELGYHINCKNRKGTDGRIIKDKKCLDGFRIGVDNIYDKTGEVFGTSDGISDMVLGAFSKMNFLPMVNLNKASVYGNLNIRENLFSINYKNHKKYTQNPGIIAQMPIGVLKPTDFYISGALLQYDKKSKNKTNIDIKYASFGRDFDIIDVALDLRVVNSTMGIISMPSHKKTGRKSTYISLQNRVVSFSVDGEYFKLIHDDAYGINISHQIGDPTQYAVREIVELATLELVSKWFGVHWTESDAPRYVKAFHSRHVIKDQK